MTEADRVLVYLGVLLAAFLIAQTEQRRQRFAEGIVFALILVGVLGLATRLLPHVFPVAEGLGSGPRLRYPLGYWNANGVACGIAAALIPWLEPALADDRAALACSRLPTGGPADALLHLLARRRAGAGWSPRSACSSSRTTVSGCSGRSRSVSSGRLPAVLAVQARDSLADNVDNATAVDQGGEVLLILLAGTALALVLFAGDAAAGAPREGVTGRAVAISRDPRALRARSCPRRRCSRSSPSSPSAAAPGTSSRAPTSSSRTSPRSTSATSPAPAATTSTASPSTPSRKSRWLGHGAGTYQFSWVKLRSIAIPVHNAHSLYLRGLRRAGGDRRPAGPGDGRLPALDRVRGLARRRAAPPASCYAALLAAALAFAVGIGVRLVLGDRRPRRRLLPRQRRPRSPPAARQLARARAAGNGRGKTRAGLRARDRRPRDRLARRPWR